MRRTLKSSGRSLRTVTLTAWPTAGVRSDVRIVKPTFAPAGTLNAPAESTAAPRAVAPSRARAVIAGIVLLVELQVNERHEERPREDQQREPEQRQAEEHIPARLLRGRVGDLHGRARVG